jgi:hypothetical protein
MPPNFKDDLLVCKAQDSTWYPQDQSKHKAV